MIAGCLNQSRRIFELFEEVLQGEAPEILVEKAHDSIKTLLKSDEAQLIMNAVEDDSEGSVAARDSFIKKIIGSVPPIIPIALRNRSLDSGYFRTALQLLGATELLFTRYVSDVRVLANPAGVVGMCTSMHSEFEREAFLGEGLKPLKESMRDMKAQYQTSLGLGSPFSKDKKQGKRTRRRPFYRGRRYGPQGFGQRRMEDISHQNMASQGFGAPGQQNLRDSNRASTTGGNSTRGVCYDYQSGDCRRGNACRFLHVNN